MLLLGRISRRYSPACLHSLFLEVPSFGACKRFGTLFEKKTKTP